MTDTNQEVKYANIQLVGTEPLDRMQSYGSYQTPDEMLKRCYGYVSICADKQASFISTVPLRLYHRTSTSSTQATKRHNARMVNRERIKHLTSASGVGFKTALYAETAGEIEEIVDAPILQLLHKPNDNMLGTDFAYSLAWARATTGNSYVYLERSGKTITSMYVMYPQYTNPVIKDGNLVGYTYGNNSNEVFGTDEVMHQKYRPSRYSQVYGECPLHSVLIAADILNAQNMRELCFQENNARPDFVVKVPAEASPQQMVDTENKFNSRMRGHKNSGKFLVVKDSEITPLGFSPKDLEGSNLRREMKQEIFAAYGISESEFATNDANLASSSTGNLQFYRNIKPLLIKNAEELTNSLIPLFYPNAEDGEYFFAYDEVLPEAAKPTLTPAERLSLGIMSINEMRAELGLAPIEGGDSVRINGQTLDGLDSQSMLPLAGLTAPATEAVAPQEQSSKSAQTIYSPNDPMVEEALRGLLWAMEYGRGGDDTSRKIAKAIVDRQPFDVETIREMSVYFANMKLEIYNTGWSGGEGYPIAERITYAMYGGDAGRAWTDMAMGGIQPVGGLPPNTVLGPDEGALAAPTAEHKTCDDACGCNNSFKVLPPNNPEEYPDAYSRVDERDNFWRKKIYCDHRTDTKTARKEVHALQTAVASIYRELSTKFSMDANGDFSECMTEFEDALSGKLGEYLYASLVRGNEDGQVRINRMKKKAAQPSLDVVPEHALEILTNYTIDLARQITENEKDALNQIIQDALRDGTNMSETVRNIKALLNENSTYKAERIARTETARAYVQGQSIAWQDAGVTKVKAILAPNSCSNCRDLVTAQGEGIDINTVSSERPPFHPSCRCDEEPVLE